MSSNKNWQNIKVVVGIVTYGDRWHLLQKAIEAILKESGVSDIVIVDNSSKNKIQDIVSEKYKDDKNILDKFKIISNSKNYGSAGGYAQLINECRKVDSDYVLLLDDDNVPEHNFLNLYLDNLDYIKSLNIKNDIDINKIVLCGNRNGDKAEEIFRAGQILDYKKTFFSIFNIRKIVNIFKSFYCGIINKKNFNLAGPKVFKATSFAYGGALIPMTVVREAKLPDCRLFLYSDDIEYSWGVRDLGYDIYACKSPIVNDIDASFSDGSHLTGLFLPSTSDIKVYFNIRNKSLISMRYARGFVGGFVLVLNVILWVILLAIYAVFKIGPTKINWREYGQKLKIITLASYKGLMLDYELPEWLNMRDDSEILKSVV